nr:Fe(3+)-hydroxamate ABC transporter permease FhuB [Azospirillum endophyticum]
MAEGGFRCGAQLALLALLAAALTAVAVQPYLPGPPWTAGTWRWLLEGDGDVRRLILADSLLPRLCTGLLCGGALGLAGVLFQQVLRNPLAEPSTLGVAGGAQLALMAAATLLPGFGGFGDLGRGLAALAGAAGSAALVVGLAWRAALAPAVVILAGLAVGLTCSALASGLMLFNGAGFQALFLWASGSLNQNGWAIPLALAPQLALGAVLALLLARPLALLDLGTEGAAGLGIPVRTLRLATLALAVALSAAVVSAAGVIGFVGLAAPAMARLAGARSLSARLAWAPPLGAALLWLADAAAQVASQIAGGGRELPTGTLTALLGAPLLLWLLTRSGGGGGGPPLPAETPARRLARPGPWLLAGLLALLLASWLALAVGQGIGGWRWSGWADLQPLLYWRAPRMAAAMAAGAMLGTAGVLLQRLTGNPMAGPEVLGIGTGAAFGVILLYLAVPAFPVEAQVAAAGAGALATLCAVLLLGRRHGHAPERLLLTGVALTTVFGAVVALLLSSGDPRAFTLFRWLTGSTYLVTPAIAVAAWAAALPLVAAPLLCARWLEILPLGEEAARGLGLRLPLVRGVVLLLVAALTTAATLVVGPLSFVGLMAPHAAHLCGLQRAVPQLAGAALAGALVMVLADWLGRVLLFPAQMPAGLLATLLGAPYLLWLLRR